jgi:hypothetical protein
MPRGLDVLTIRGGRIAENIAFLTADLARLGLAATIHTAQ